MNARDFAAQVAVGVVTLLVVEAIQKQRGKRRRRIAPPQQQPRARVLVAS